MPEIRKVSVALTGQQVVLLRGAVASGEYATTSEIVREALRDWQRKRELHGEDVERLRQLWAEGKKSGPARSAELGEVRKAARQRLEKAAQGQLPHAG